MDFLTPIATSLAPFAPAGSAFCGGVSSGVSWKSTPAVSSTTVGSKVHLVITAVATAIILSELISGICDIWGVNIKIVCGLCGSAGYLGPEYLIKPLFSWILKKYGVTL